MGAGRASIEVPDPRPTSKRVALRRGCRGAGPPDQSAAWQRNEYGDLPAVAAVLVAEHRDEIALLELDGDQDVAGGRHRKQQVAGGHRWGAPEREQETQIDRVPDVPVEKRRVELR